MPSSNSKLELYKMPFSVLLFIDGVQLTGPLKGGSLLANVLFTLREINKDMLLQAMFYFLNTVFCAFVLLIRFIVKNKNFLFSFVLKGIYVCHSQIKD